MSIWASWLSIDAYDHEPDCAKWNYGAGDCDGAGRWLVRRGRQAKLMTDVACTCGSGPLIYHGSHVDPDRDMARGGGLDLAFVPNHCHPSVRGTGSDTGPRVEYVRLSVDEDPATYHGGVPGSATVVLDRAQAEALASTLRTWLDTEEVA